MYLTGFRTRPENLERTTGTSYEGVAFNLTGLGNQAPVRDTVSGVLDLQHAVHA